MQNALNKSNNRKTKSPDNILTELFKTLIKSTSITIIEQFNAIYGTGYIPKNWLFFAIPKISKTKEIRIQIN